MIIARTGQAPRGGGHAPQADRSQVSSKVTVMIHVESPDSPPCRQIRVKGLVRRHLEG